MLLLVVMDTDDDEFEDDLSMGLEIESLERDIGMFYKEALSYEDLWYRRPNKKKLEKKKGMQELFNSVPTMSSADYLCKQIGPRSGPIDICWS